MSNLPHCTKDVEASREAHTLEGPEEFEYKGEVTTIEPIKSQIELSPDRQPWERQPQESGSEWDMFRAWRDLDPHERTYARAHRMMHNGREVPKNVSSIFGRLAKRFRWRERVNAYDNHVDKKIREALEAQRMRARLETAQLGRSMRQKAKEAVDALKSIVMIEEDGELVPRSSLSPSDITKLAKVGSELESVALEGGTQGGGGMALGIQINIGDSELRERAREILDLQSQVENVTKQMIDITPASKEADK